MHLLRDTKNILHYLRDATCWFALPSSTQLTLSFEALAHGMLVHCCQSAPHVCNADMLPAIYSAPLPRHRMLCSHSVAARARAGHRLAIWVAVVVGRQFKCRALFAVAQPPRQKHCKGECAGACIGPSCTSPLLFLSHLFKRRKEHYYEKGFTGIGRSLLSIYLCLL